MMVLKGEGKSRFSKDDRLIKLKAGDHVLISRNTLHRVEWASLKEKTILLAVHGLSKGGKNET
ncbi:MAG: hypothetical protein KKB22_02580 [Candidatus Omnitrophica bacterium]|nr:hypothetical protein [Candidatus Omnitrophota bacterium]